MARFSVLLRISGLQLRAGLLASLTMLACSIALAQQPPAPADYNAWPVLQNPFPSTGGGGVMIDGYKPVIEGKLCRTDFLARMPDGKVFENMVEFDAVPEAGGILCTRGRWRAKSGTASGTTPFQVFIRGGVVRRAP